MEIFALIRDFLLLLLLIKFDFSICNIINIEIQLDKQERCNSRTRFI